MVRVTQSLCKYIPEWYHLQRSSSSYFKKQAYFQMTRFYKGNGWNTWKNSMKRYQYLLKGEMWNARQISNNKRDINRMRIAAACEENGYKYQYLVSTLPKVDINLNLASLANLAIYEPKTFATLVDISKQLTSQPLEPANFNPERL